MPRFYFHFHSSHGAQADDIGIVLADDFEAGHAGLAGVRELLDDAIKSEAMLDLSGRFRIVDQGGREIIQIAFTDHLTIA